MKIRKIHCLLLCLPLSVMADQKQGFFAGASAAYIGSETFVSPVDSQEDLGFPALEIGGGYKYNSFLGVDLRIGFGTVEQDAATTTASERVEYSLNSYYSLYYRPEIINEAARLYALLGYTSIDVSSDEIGGNTDAEYSESGFSYGLGIAWFLDDTVSVGVEYRMLIDVDEQEFDSISLGFDYRF